MADSLDLKDPTRKLNTISTKDMTMEKELIQQLIKALEEFSSKQYQVETKPEIETYDGTRNSRKVHAFLAALDNAIFINHLTTDEAKKTYMARYLVGEAQNWWANARFREDKYTYSALIREFKNDFIDFNNRACIIREFRLLQQKTTVCEYVYKFKKIYRELGTDYASDRFYRDFFLDGLKPNVYALVRAQLPKSLDAAMNIAIHASIAFDSYTEADEEILKVERKSNYMKIKQSKNRNVECCYCHKKGHFRQDCWNRLRSQEKFI